MTPDDVAQELADALTLRDRVLAEIAKYLDPPTDYYPAPWLALRGEIEAHKVTFKWRTNVESGWTCLGCPWCITTDWMMSAPECPNGARAVARIAVALGVE